MPVKSRKSISRKGSFYGKSTFFLEIHDIQISMKNDTKLSNFPEAHPLVPALFGSGSLGKVDDTKQTVKQAEK